MRIVLRRVLWTLVPIGSLGLLGWVPPLRIALRTRTLAAWSWFAGFAGGVVLVIVLTSTVQATPGVEDKPPSWVGAIEVLYIISAAVYTCLAMGKMPASASGPSRRAAQGRNAYAYGRYPGQPTFYPPAPAPTPAPLSPQPVAVQPVVMPPAVAPNAVDSAAAEVQAELRRLRDYLGESAGGRRQDGHDGPDRRGER